MDRWWHNRMLWWLQILMDSEYHFRMSLDRSVTLIHSSPNRLATADTAVLSPFPTFRARNIIAKAINWRCGVYGSDTGTLVRDDFARRRHFACRGGRRSVEILITGKMRKDCRLSWRMVEYSRHNGIRFLKMICGRFGDLGCRRLADWIKLPAESMRYE